MAYTLAPVTFEDLPVGQVITPSDWWPGTVAVTGTSGSATVFDQAGSKMVQFVGRRGWDLPASALPGAPSSFGSTFSYAADWDMDAVHTATVDLLLWKSAAGTNADMAGVALHSPTGKLQIRVDIGGVISLKMTQKDYSNARKWQWTHHVDQTAGMQWLYVHRRSSGKLVETISLHCGLDPVVTMRFGTINAAADGAPYSRLDNVRVSSERLYFAAASGYTAVWADWDKIYLAGSISGGPEARLIVESTLFNDPAPVPIPNGAGRIQLVANKKPDVVAAGADITWKIQILVGGESWEDADEGTVRVPLPPGTAGVQTGWFWACAPNSVSDDFEPFTAVLDGPYDLDYAYCMGDWMYLDVQAPLYVGGVPDHSPYVQDDVDQHWEAATVPMDIRLDLEPAMRRIGMGWDGDDHDAGDGGNGRAPESHRAWVEMFRTHWAPYINHGDGRPTGCNWNDKIIGRVWHVWPDSRCSQRLAPDFNNPAGAGQTDPYAWLGQWQMDKLQAILTDGRWATGEVVALDFHCTSVLIPSYTGEQLAGKPDAGSSYPAAMALLDTMLTTPHPTTGVVPRWAMDQFDWHGSIGITRESGKNPRGGGNGIIVGAAGLDRRGLGHNIDSVDAVGPGGGGVHPSQFDHAYPPIGEPIDTSSRQSIQLINRWTDLGSSIRVDKILYDSRAGVERFVVSDEWTGLLPPLVALRGGFFINGDPLEDYATKITRRDATWEIPGRRGDNRVIPTRGGRLFNAEKRHDEGRIVLSMFALGANEDGTVPVSQEREVRATLGKLSRLFTAPGLLEVWWIDPDRAIRCFAEAAKPITFESEDGVLADFVVALTVPSGFWEDIDAITQTVPFTGGGLGSVETLLFTNFAGGEAPIDDSVITVNGRIFGPIRLSDNNSDGWVRYLPDMGNVAVIEINNEAFTVRKLNDDTDAIADIERYGSGALLTLQPRPSDGAVAIRVNAGVNDLGDPDIGSGAQVKVVARRKYPIA